MEPERWRELELLLTEALERDPQDRSAWLERRCAGDPALLEDVRSLLAVQGRAEGFLESSAAPGSPREPGSPWEIGPYRVLRRIATGGMGVVYEAQRDGVEGRVALKVMRAELCLDDTRLRLFQREVAALKRLDHPSIARISEAGVTPEGLHYLALELVPGERLDHWVRSRAPALDERLATFCAVCDAVHHAHERGVVHRDLKPSNVIVDPRGHPKVVDFGLARLIGPTGRRTTSLSDLVEIMGTLPYMSPEQAGKDPGDVDARSDVYALGVLLYELLVDRLPFDFDQVHPHESLRMICEEEPLRLGAVEPALRGDLETIVQKALEKDPARRYASVAALVQDVRSHLGGRRIEARPPGAMRRTRATIRRHKVLSVAVAGVVLALAVFSATLWTKNRELRVETTRATEAESAASSQAALAHAEAERAREVIRFLQHTLESVSPDVAKGREVTVREVLDQTSLGLTEEYVDEPVTRAALHETIGRAYHSIGRAALAAEHLGAYLELSAGTPAGSKPRRAAAHHLLGSALEAQGKYARALEEQEASLSLYRELEQAEDLVAGVLVDLARLHSSLGDGESAAARLEQAREVAAKLPHSGSSRTAEVALLNAELVWRAGDARAAEDLFHEALEHQLELHGEQHSRTADVLAQLAQLVIEGGRVQEAAELLERSLEARRALLGEDHYAARATGSSLATVYFQLGRLDEAAALLLEIVESWPEDDTHEDLAATLSTLGAVCSKLGRDEQALHYMTEALEAYRASEGSAKETVSDHLANLARVQLDLGHVADAENNALESLELRREVLGGADLKVSDGLQLLAHIRYETGQLAAAAELLAESVEIRAAALGEGHAEVAVSRQVLDELLAELDGLAASDAREASASNE